MSKEFGRKLKELRLANNYTEEQLAELLEVSLEDYREFEHGETEPSVYKLFMLTKILNTDIPTLFEYEE